MNYLYNSLFIVDRFNVLVEMRGTAIMVVPLYFKPIHNFILLAALLLGIIRYSYLYFLLPSPAFLRKL